MENQRRLSQKNKAVLDLIKRGKLPKEDIQKIPQKKRALWALGQNIENPTPEDEYMLQTDDTVPYRTPSKLGFGRSRKQKKNKQKKTKRHSKKW